MSNTTRTNQPTLPELASSIRRLADGLDAGATTTPLIENAAQLRLAVLCRIGTLAFKQIDGPAQDYPEVITRRLAMSPTARVITSTLNPSLSPDDRALLSSLMQGGRLLASVGRGENIPGDSARLRLIAEGIAPQAKASDSDKGPEVGETAGSSATPAETPDTIVVEGVRRPVEKSAGQAAKILDVSKHTAIKYCEQGLLDWRDVTPWGRRTYAISLRSIQKLLAGHSGATRGNGVKRARRSATVAPAKSSRHFKSPV